MGDVIWVTGPDECPLDLVKSRDSRAVGPVPNSRAAEGKVTRAVDRYHASGLGGEVWRKLSARGCYFGVIMLVLCTIWTHFNPIMGNYAFSSSASLFLRCATLT
jgi:hypothetical protein